MTAEQATTNVPSGSVSKDEYKQRTREKMPTSPTEEPVEDRSVAHDDTDKSKMRRNDRNPQGRCKK